MGHLSFYLAVVAACLLWSAAFTAAAARTRPGWVRWFLMATAVVVPVLALLPWVFWTAMLAFRVRLGTNWFAPTLTAVIAAAIGGTWIVRAGLSPRAAPAAATWPLVGLTAMFVLAKAVAAGTLLFVDNAVRAEARAARVEAAGVLQSVVPPAPPPDDDAAPLYRQAFERLAADKTLEEESSPLAELASTDISAPVVAELLARHGITLDLIRRAADRPGCRFDRDWSRPSLDMLVPELQPMLQAARLLAVAARREAVDGDTTAALADVVRLHRMALQAGAEPILVSGLMGVTIDSIALETLAAVLPTVAVGDKALLETPALGDFVRSSWSFQRHFFGEEAFGLSLFASLVDDGEQAALVDVLKAGPGGGDLAVIPGKPLNMLFRCFLLPADLAAYRVHMKQFQKLADQAARPESRYAAIHGEAEAIEQRLMQKRAGIFTSLLAPVLGSVLKAEAKSKALHRAAEVLLAATQARVKAGSPPESVESLLSEYLVALPVDPFRERGPLTIKTDADDWLVYSVGPDGEDDGGPVPAGAEKVEGNDDVGLRLAL